uniref:Palmitoyltransferase ZDHHC17 n=1 Tax=Anthurium amnicola TaxID=1678845 RepID=A0A1D1Y4T0_9ARAE
MEASLIRVQTYASFSCVTRKPCQPQFRNRRAYAPLSMRRICISMCLGGSNTGAPSFRANSALSYSEDKPDQLMDELAKSYTTAEAVDKKVDAGVLSHEGVSVHGRKAAKIHDFCLGIPFGGFVLSGGLVGFIFSRNLATLSAGLLFGGALLSLSFFSLKVWKHGLSSLPFILGQGAIAAMLFWKHFQTYSMTKKIFPAGFYALLSGAMFCFYSYVLISGGNPPPKKLAAKPASNP